MIPVLNSNHMRGLDAHMIEKGIPSLLLMENAAFGLTNAVTNKFSTEKKITVVCGSGNNGGDGFAAARQLLTKGFDVSVLLVGKTKKLKGDAKANADFFGSDIVEITDENTADIHMENIGDSIVIDALFGTGLSRDITGVAAYIISLVNNSKAYVISCDIASGIAADTGAVCGAAVRANETVTFQYPKPGHLLYPGKAHTGGLTVWKIGVDCGYDLGAMFWAADDLKLQRRKRDSHKGHYGKLACIVGSQGMAGAGVLCACAAIKAGAGLTTAAVPECIQSSFSTNLPESMTFALKDFSGCISEDCVPELKRLMVNKTALAAGPGLSVCNGTAVAVRHLLQNYNIRKVFDADALNIIAQDPAVLHDSVGDIVLTPHIAEFSRLSAQTIEELQKNAIDIAKRFAKEYGVTLLLKGATTVVTNGTKTVFITAGTAGMARGGSGDVLTGVIGGLMCGGQAGGMCGFDAAVYGSYICGKAGEFAEKAKGELSMSAAETLGNIFRVTKQMTNR